MHGHPATAADAHRAHLPLVAAGVGANPDAGTPAHPVGRNLPLGARPDDGLFQFAQVAVQVVERLALGRVEPVQVEDRVHHHLPRTVERDVAAAVDRHEGGAEAVQLGLAGEQVRRVAALAQRVHGRVFHDQDGVREGPRRVGTLGCYELILEPLLEGPRFAVRHPPEAVESSGLGQTHRGQRARRVPTSPGRTASTRRKAPSSRTESAG